MSKQPSKADLRRQIEEQIRNYLRGGGEVAQVPKGASGRDPLTGPRRPVRNVISEPRTERTYVPEVIAAIEARRRQRPPATVRRPPRRQSPRKKIIYDEFGEPIRFVWVDG